MNLHTTQPLQKPQLMLHLLSQSCRSRFVVSCCRSVSGSTKPTAAMAARPSLEPVQPIHWVLDWDGTITRHDTLDALVSIPAASKPNSPVLDEWKRVSEAYMSDYTTAMKKLAPGGKLPSTIQEEKKLLHSLSAVEQASLARVSGSKIFECLTRELLDDGAASLMKSRKVELRNGFVRFLKMKESRDHDSLDLLSVNWSRHFIGSCLRAADAPVRKDAIHANELDGIEKDQVSQGKISPDEDAEMLIICSGDKLQCMAQLREQALESTNTKVNSYKPIVYVGDSWTDIECLLEADLGICIRDEPLGSSQKKLSERLESLGVYCPHLYNWRDADDWQVVWAKDFAEIQAWVEVYGA